MWRFTDGKWIAGFNLPGSRPLRTDREGRLRGTWVMDPMSTPLLGLSEDRQRAAFVWPTSDENHRYVVRGRVVLEERVLFKATARTAAGPPTGGLQVHIGFAHPAHSTLMIVSTFAVDSHEISLPVPSGTYSFCVRGGGGLSIPRSARLEQGSGSFDLGPVTIPVTPFSLIGEVFPDWVIDEARNIALEDADLVDFRGKPLVVVFAEWSEREGPRTETRERIATLADHPRREDFHMVLFDTWTGSPGDPNEPVIEDTLPLLKLRYEESTESRVLQSHRGTVVLDENGRLVHHGEIADVAATLAALARVLGPPSEDGRK